MANVKDFDLIYISYDEPNAEENWLDLQVKIPYAKRVHGIKGFDAAHKYASKIAETDHFFTVDGDNRIDPEFIDQEVNIINHDYVYSWSSQNVINGLIYGNGGIKLWPKHVVQNMNCHENINGIDFCWVVPYYQMNDWFSISYCNASPYQAFRAGFREGVKMSLNEGKKVQNLKTDIWHGNLRRLLIWMTVGNDVDNGRYAIYGARLGCYLTNTTDFDISRIADYDYLNERWCREWRHFNSYDYNELRDKIGFELNLPLVELDAKQSEFVKTVQLNPARQGLMFPKLAEEDYLMKNNFTRKII